MAETTLQDWLLKQTRSKTIDCWCCQRELIVATDWICNAEIEMPYHLIPEDNKKDRIVDIDVCRRCYRVCFAEMMEIYVYGNAYGGWECELSAEQYDADPLPKPKDNDSATEQMRLEI